MCYVFIGIGAFFLLFGIIMCIPTKKNNNTTSISAKVVECKEERPDIEHALEYSETIDVKDTKFNYNILCEYEYNGVKQTTVITSHKKKDLGDKVKITIASDGSTNIPPEEKTTKITGTLIGGIVGVILSLVFIIIGILMKLGKL